MALRCGLTTIRNLGSDNQLDLLLRDSIQARLNPGPQILGSGEYIHATGGHGHPHGRPADGVDEVRKAVREQIAAGADWIKIMCSGGVGEPQGGPDGAQYTAAEIAAAVNEAALAGRAVAAHAHSPRAVGNALRAGVRSIEHGNYLDARSIRDMVTQDAFLVPTFAVYAVLADSSLYPEYSVAARDALPIKRQVFAAALDAGLAWGVGSDASRLPIELYLDELRILADEIGLGPRETIFRATAGNAKLLGLEDRGTLEPGQRADILVVEGDPYQDIGDIVALRQTIVAGEVFDWSTLARPLRLRPRVARDQIHQYAKPSWTWPRFSDTSQSPQGGQAS